MGSGKSYLGSRLASRLGVGFVDTDIIISETYNLSISKIFETEGEHKFRQSESVLLNTIMKDNLPKVVAVGGGMPCHSNNMERMNSSGYTIFLDCPTDVLVNRIKNSEDRPLIKGHEGNLDVYVHELLHKRRHEYQTSDLILKTPSLEDLVSFTSGILGSESR
jgi:shikimate kinase